MSIRHDQVHIYFFYSHNMAPYCDNIFSYCLRKKRHVYILKPLPIASIMAIPLKILQYFNERKKKKRKRKEGLLVQVLYRKPLKLLIFFTWPRTLK